MKTANGKKKTEKGTKDVVVQSVVFEKDKWKPDDAKKWLKSHGMRYSKIDEQKSTLRFRQ